jgi:hypothetical protein
MGLAQASASAKLPDEERPCGSVDHTMKFWVASLVLSVAFGAAVLGAALGRASGLF